MTAAENGMACEGKLPLGRKYTNAVVCKWNGRPQEERCFAQVCPIGERCHPRIGQRIGVDNYGQRIASQWLIGKLVNLAKYKFGHLIPAVVCRPRRALRSLTLAPSWAHLGSSDYHPR